MLPSQCHINLTSSQIHITRTAELLLHCNIGGYPGAMSTLPKTLTLDTSTSRANPTPQPMKRLTVPRIRQRKGGTVSRSEEHTSELQSLMRISYAVFCLKKKNTHTTPNSRKTS